MKTAYQTLLSVMNKDCESVFKDSNGDGYVDLSLYTFETAMKDYAHQVATQALKDAAENAKMRIEDFSSGRSYLQPYPFSDPDGDTISIDKESITNTKIETP